MHKGVSNGGRPGRMSPTYDRTSAVVGGKDAHARPECPSDGLAPRIDVRLDVRHCGEGRMSAIFILKKKKKKKKKLYKIFSTTIF